MGRPSAIANERDQFRRTASEQGVPEDEVARFAELIRFQIHAGQRAEGGHAGRRGGRPGRSQRSPATAASAPPRQSTPASVKPAARSASRCHAAGGLHSGLCPVG